MGFWQRLFCEFSFIGREFESPRRFFREHFPFLERKLKGEPLIMSDPKYAYPYPAPGYPQGYPQQAPPVQAPPAYGQQPPRQQGFLEGCLAALCCCCLLDECCCDPSVICDW